MKPTALVVVVAAWLPAWAAAAVGPPTWICTTADRPFAAQPSPTAVPDSAATADVVVYPAAVGQTIDGFGGCFNELGWKTP